MSVLSAIVRLLVSVLVVAPVVRFGVPLGPGGDAIDDGRAIAVALVVGIAWLLLVAAVGRIPVLGGLAAIATFAGVIYALTPGDVRTASLLGLVSWALAVVVLHGFALTAHC